MIFYFRILPNRFLSSLDSTEILVDKKLGHLLVLIEIKGIKDNRKYLRL